MARAAKIDLRAFQQELAARLAGKTAAEVESSRLGLDSAGQHWLIRLADAGEVIPVPHLVGVPLTKPWFLGLANIRGNLFSVVDFAGFLGHGATPWKPGGAARLVLFGPRVGELRVGILVPRVLGLRNLAELKPAPAQPDAPRWYGQRWADAADTQWQEIDLTRFALDPDFLQVGL